MRYKAFGKTGMNLSEMCLGTWGMGGVGWNNYSEAERVDAIAAALENGINFFDTAPAYNGGAAEKLLGKALKDLGARDNVYITTKCGNFFTDGITYVKDSTPAALRKQCEESLRNLQTDHIDLLLIHWPDPKTPFEVSMEELMKLKDEGKINHIGVSNFSVAQMEEISQFGPVDAYQPQYSMVWRESLAQMEWAKEHGLGVMTYGSIGGGILSGKIRTLTEYAPTDSRNRFYKFFKEPYFSKVMELLAVMDEISANRGGVPLAQIALNWSAQQDLVSTCIVGAQTRAKILENAAAFEWTLDEAELSKINAAIENYFAQV